jgi:hypothetical protein
MASLDPTALQALPMFPLPNVVLFPGALLPLHVFEPRYREMTRDVLAGNKLMAVSRLKPGYDEEAYLGRPGVFDVAGVGSIVASDELADGRFYMVLRGLARVHIEAELPVDCAYRKIRARLLTDETPPANLVDVGHQQLLALCDRLALVVNSDGDELRKLARSAHDGGACADLMASALVDDPDLRQGLLEQLDPARRLDRVSDFVARLIRELDPNREMLN